MVAQGKGASYKVAMISVIIPTLNAERGLVRTFGCLILPTVQGLVREVIVVDSGSSDGTCRVAEGAGATLLHTQAGRGRQLSAGAHAARSEWLLFLHGDTALQPGWSEEVEAFLEQQAMAEPGREKTAVFAFKLDSYGWRARWLEIMVAIRCALFGLPYGDQGLLISRALYTELGGFKPIPLMEDVDLVRRIGRRRLVFLRAAAVTSGQKYESQGYLRRSLRNLLCLTLYFLRVPPRIIARIYG